MDQQQALVNIDTLSAVIAEGSNRGKYWAAIKDEQVMALLPMQVAYDVDFEQYKSYCKQALVMLGEVKAGEVYLFAGKRYFVLRLNHANRSKAPRVPKVLEVYV